MTDKPTTEDHQNDYDQRSGSLEGATKRRNRAFMRKSFRLPIYGSRTTSSGA